MSSLMSAGWVDFLMKDVALSAKERNSENTLLEFSMLDSSEVDWFYLLLVSVLIASSFGDGFGREDWNSSNLNRTFCIMPLRLLFDLLS